MIKKQGRPASPEEAGRDRVLQGVRSLLRSPIDHSVSRQEVARSAGVTPALVTYYFPSQSDLLIEATRPILEDALNQVDAIIAAGGSYNGRLRALIQLFLYFSSKDGKLLEVFIEAAFEAKSQKAQFFIFQAFSRLSQFFVDGSNAGEWRAVEPSFFLFALWGMCKFVGEPPRFPIGMFAGADVQDDMRAKQVDAIADLLLNGLAAKSA